MNTLFQRSKSGGQDEVEKKLLQLPEPPLVDQIVADLEDATPSDVVFNSDVASLLDVPTSQVVKEIPKRFQNLSSGEADLYEKVIQHNQNVERSKALRAQLLEAQNSLSQLNEDLTDDITRVSTDLKKAGDLHQEVNNK